MVLSLLLLLSTLCIVHFSNAQGIQYNLSAFAVLDADHNCNVSLSILPSKGIVSINMTGPDSLWFSVGFGGTTMKDTYSIVCAKEYKKNGSSTPICVENTLSASGYGQSLSPSITVVSDYSTKNIRRVSMTRNISLFGSKASNYFSFPTTSTTINIIHAIGKNDTFTNSTSHMGPGGVSTLTITDGVSNNLTTPSTPLGVSMVLNSLVIYPDRDLVEINITGPETVYFGIGFNSTEMNGAYAIICDDTGGCYENEFQGKNYGIKLPSTLNVISSITSNGKRTVVVHRKRNILMDGGDGNISLEISESNSNNKYFQFPSTTTTFPVIYAIGMNKTWSGANGMSYNASTYGSKEITLSASGSNHSNLSNSSLVMVARKVLFSKVHHVLELSVDPSNSKNMVNITMSGPSDKWFGIGFGTTMMQNAYSIICSPDRTHCFEQTLSASGVGQTISKQFISTVSDHISGSVRTVELQRKRAIGKNDSSNYTMYYSFPSVPSIIPVIYSYGTNGVFVQGQSHMDGFAASALTLSNLTKRSNLSASVTLPEVDQDLMVHILPDQDAVKIMMTGPDDKWFGIGFDVESNGKNGTYAIIADTTTTVKEYYTDSHTVGMNWTAMTSSNLKVTRDESGGKQRRVTVERTLSLLDPKGFDFPVSPRNVSFIGLEGTVLMFNATNSSILNTTSSTLDFKPFTPSNGGGNTSNSSMCTADRVSYGTSGAVGNGLTVGLTVYCQTKTIRIKMEYQDYDQNWIGIVFNDHMLDPYSCIFTTGKPDETQRDLALYSYAINDYDSGDVVYHPEHDWTAISQTEANGSVMLTYEVPLSNTKWSTSTRKITFRYAWGQPKQLKLQVGSQCLNGNGCDYNFHRIYSFHDYHPLNFNIFSLFYFPYFALNVDQFMCIHSNLIQEHLSTAYSETWTFDLATGSISSSNDNLTLKKVHGIIMIMSWSILASIGIFASRFRVILFQNSKNKAMWFLVHRGVQTIAVILVLIAFAISVYFVSDAKQQHFTLKHEWMGLTVVVLTVLQPINAWLRPHPQGKGMRTSMPRLIWEIIHKSFGYITWILAQVSIYLGIQQLTDDRVYTEVFMGFAGAQVVVFMALWGYKCLCFREKVVGDGPLIQREKKVSGHAASHRGRVQRSEM